MPKIIELKGKDIINAYDGDKLSNNFGYSCANFNCDYQKNVDMDLFDIYVDNTNNISCFVYINNEGLIEGRRMFFKGKQLLDNKVFPINTKLNDEIYYLYGYYGNRNGFINNVIIKHVINKYKDKLVCMDNGHFNKGSYREEREYWVMEIENMDYPEFPAIDFLYASAELISFSNFNPSINIKNWLKDTYNKDEVRFHSAYHFTPGKGGGVDFMKHWNQKYFDEDDIQDEDEQHITYYDDESQEEIQEKLKGFKTFKNKKKPD